MSITSQEFQDAISVYKEGMDSLIENIGKNIRLVFIQEITAEVSQDFDDEVRGGQIRKPLYKDNAPTKTETYELIKGLIQYDPNDYKNYDLRINNSSNILRLKTYINNTPSLLKCDYIIPNFDISGYLYAKYSLLREPIPVGLGQDIYTISFWERVT